jgi:hypothetical protein
MAEASPFRFEHEGQMGTLRAILVLDCPKCGKTTRFSARDEAADGSFLCDCGLRVGMTKDRISDYQSGLDKLNRSVQNLGETFKRLSKR